MAQRIILHSDADAFYASVEAAREPSLRGKVMAVCGSVEERHGIVLAKSEGAKRAGVKTGMTVGEALRLCPSLLTVPPHFGLYAEYSEKLRLIYSRFSDRVEPYGPDECWLDLSPAVRSFEDGKVAADSIRRQVVRELGITVSVGVSFNKVFAKLGSDLAKPNGTAVISERDFRAALSPLPVERLWGVGNAAKRLLNKYGISTIGQLAECRRDFLKSVLGKNGETLWASANGLDCAAVVPSDEAPPVKSVGHGGTTARDLASDDEVRRFMLALCQDIGARLRQYRLRCRGVCVSTRDRRLSVRSFRRELERPTSSAADIARAAFRLFEEEGGLTEPLRSLRVSAIRLESSALPLQTDMFCPADALAKREALDRAADLVRKKYGKRALLPASICKSPLIFPEADFSMHIMA